MKTDDPAQLHQFERFMKRREEAAQAYVCGNAAPLDRMLTRRSDASFFGPGGGHVNGAQQVASRYDHDTGAFDDGSQSRFEILQMGADAGIGYWVGIQRATVNMKGQSEAVAMDLRVTEIFRKEGDDWKLVHRHADDMAEEKKKGQS